MTERYVRVTFEMFLEVEDPAALVAAALAVVPYCSEEPAEIQSSNMDALGALWMTAVDTLEDALPGCRQWEASFSAEIGRPPHPHQRATHRSPDSTGRGD